MCKCICEQPKAHNQDTHVHVNTVIVTSGKCSSDISSIHVQRTMLWLLATCLPAMLKTCANLPLIGYPVTHYTQPHTQVQLHAHLISHHNGLPLNALWGSIDDGFVSSLSLFWVSACDFLPPELFSWNCHLIFTHGIHKWNRTQEKTERQKTKQQRKKNIETKGNYSL